MFELYKQLAQLRKKEFLYILLALFSSVLFGIILLRIVYVTNKGSGGENTIIHLSTMLAAGVVFFYKVFFVGIFSAHLTRAVMMGQRRSTVFFSYALLEAGALAFVWGLLFLIYHMEDALNAVWYPKVPYEFDLKILVSLPHMLCIFGFFVFLSMLLSAVCLRWRYGSAVCMALWSCFCIFPLAFEDGKLLKSSMLGRAFRDFLNTVQDFILHAAWWQNLLAGVALAAVMLWTVKRILIKCDLKL